MTQKDVFVSVQHPPFLLLRYDRHQRKLGRDEEPIFRDYNARTWVNKVTIGGFRRGTTNTVIPLTVMSSRYKKPSFGTSVSVFRLKGREGCYDIHGLNDII